jgi:ABC-type Fe3+ transport system substrate-binding protein
MIFVNTTLVDPKTFRSYKDLLDPKWKGKIVMDDPRRAGPGQASFTFFYLHPELGPDFIRALARQEPLILRDYAQEVDAIGQGKYLVLLGTWEVPVEARIKQGVPLAIVNPHQLREVSDMSPVNGSTALYNRAPHPNAAKVYLNWLLSKEGQTECARTMGYISARLDVPTDHSPWRVPTKGAIKTYTPEAMQVKDKFVVPLLQGLFGR